MKIKLFIVWLSFVFVFQFTSECKSADLSFQKQAENFSDYLSESEAVQFALQNNYELKSAAIEIDLARAELIKARLWPNPEGQIFMSSDRLTSDEGEKGFEYGFSQAIPINGRTFFQSRVARLGIERAEWQLKEAERQLVREVRKNYFRVIVFEELKKILINLVQINENLLKAVQSRLKSGEVSEVDLSVVRGELQIAQQELSELKARLFETRAILNQLLGRNPGEAFKIENSSVESIPIASFSMEQIVEKSFENRPDLQVKEIETRMGQKGLTLARALMIPDVTLSVDFIQEKTVFNFDDQIISSNDRQVGLKVSMPLPVFNRNQGGIAQVKAEKKRAEIQSDALRILIKREVSQSYIRFVAETEILKTYQTGIIETIEKSVKLMQSAYAQGQVSFFDVVQTQGKLNNIQKSYLSTVLNSREALIDLESAAGISITNETR